MADDVALLDKDDQPFLAATRDKGGREVQLVQLDLGDPVPVIEADGLVVAGTLSAAGVLIAQQVTGGTASYRSVAFQLTSAGTGNTITFEVSNDTTNGTDGTWSTVVGYPTNATGAAIPASTVTAVGTTLVPTPGVWWRARVSTYGSGTLTAVAAFRGEPMPRIGVAATLASGTASIGSLTAGTARIGFVAGGGIWFDDTSTALGASATFTGSSRDLTVTATGTAIASASAYPKEIRVSAESDVAGTLWLEVSRDAVTWRRVKSVATAAVTGGGQYAEIVHQPSWRYARVGYTNGAAAQSRLTVGSIAVAA